MSCDCDSWQISTGGSSVPLLRHNKWLDRLVHSDLLEILEKRRMPIAKEIGQWPWLLISIKREGGIQGWNGSQAAFLAGVLTKDSVVQHCEIPELKM